MTTDHGALSTIYHWPLYAVGDDGGSVYLDCDHCAKQLWPPSNTEASQVWTFNVDVLYRVVSDHVTAGCPRAS